MLEDEHPTLTVRLTPGDAGAFKLVLLPQNVVLLDKQADATPFTKLVADTSPCGAPKPFPKPDALAYVSQQIARALAS
jgi:hypothetical protein